MAIEEWACLGQLRRSEARGNRRIREKISRIKMRRGQGSRDRCGCQARKVAAPFQIGPLTIDAETLRQLDVLVGD
jgi:hypothetical protein